MSTPRTLKPGPGLARLTRIELRKSVDTRAGRWLLAAVGAVGLIMAVVAALAGSAHDHTFHNSAAMIQGAMTVLLPVISILLVTSEWSQRTALQTFALVPRRGRVIAAKLLAGATLAITVAVVGIVLGVAATAVATHPAGGTTWHHAGTVVLGSLVVQLASLLSGMAFGLILLSSASAIVVSFVVPTAWSILATNVHALHGVRAWLDPSKVSTYLLGGNMTGLRWAQVGVVILVWVVALLVAGQLRLRQKEIV